ncbi:MAG TPA: hypothetical protein VF571_15865 [Pyrinomonadaceae bacterium]|jgi:hypothetical protein
MDFKKLKTALSDAGSREEQNLILLQILMVARSLYFTTYQAMQTVGEKFRQTLRMWGLNDEADKFFSIPDAIDDFSQKTRRYFFGAIACLIAEAILGGLVSMSNKWSFWGGAVAAIIVTLIVDAGLVCFSLVNSRQKPLQAVRLTNTILKASLVIFFVCLPIFILGRVVTGSLALSIAPLLSVGLMLTPIALVFTGASYLVLANLHYWSDRLTAQWRQKDADYRQSSEYLITALVKLSDNGYDIQFLIDEIFEECRAKSIPAPAFLDSLKQREKMRRQSVSHPPQNSPLPTTLPQTQTAKSNGGYYAQK